MDNASRSQRSRNAALDAAIKIISRDGPGRLTLDAIARESGLSKGAITHQFRTKKAVLKALLDRQSGYFKDFHRQYLADASAKVSQPELAAEIATLRKATAQPSSVVLAIVAAVAEDPVLLAASRKSAAEKLKAIRAEAGDSELALLRWAAARGLLLDTLFGMSPLGIKERDRLFERLLDDRFWSAHERPAAARTGISTANKQVKLQQPADSGD
jgi:AcrR family transcriptional regulator